MSLETVFNKKMCDFITEFDVSSTIRCILINDVRFAGHPSDPSLFSLYVENKMGFFSELVKIVVIDLKSELVHWKYLYDPTVENVGHVEDYCTCSIPRLSDETDVESWCDDLISYLRITLIRCFVSIQQSKTNCRLNI